VHNSRIERLWFDVTEGFGCKWKDFFCILEEHHSLNISDPSHIWLLHWLFLPSINRDAVAWAESWNSHKIQLDGERRSSPKQMFIRSSLTDGVHGLPPPDEDTYDGLYGVEGVTDGDRGQTGQPLDATEVESAYNEPEWVNNVVCEPPNCPLTDKQLEEMIKELPAPVDIETANMDEQRVVWVRALSILSHFWEVGENDSL
jgi:hypothetical protein